MPNILFSSLSNMPLAYCQLKICIAYCKDALVDTRHPAKLAPQALIYALNKSRLHNVCNQKCILTFPSLNLKTRKHLYSPGFNGSVKRNFSENLPIFSKHEKMKDKMDKYAI